MRGSFSPGYLEGLPVSPSLLGTIRLLGEYKGKQQLFVHQSPHVLETLREIAVVQSTESSTRLEGATAPPERIQQLVAHKTTPKNRSEQEIAGYRDALSTLHASAQRMALTPQTVLALDKDMNKFLPRAGGQWKATNNDILEGLPDGTTRVRFKPVPASMTPEAMDQLLESFDEALDLGRIDQLILIPAFVLDFLCIHPLLDGNGRMSRLLTLLLLYKAGYEVGRYISLERLVEDSKETYYEALLASSHGWHQARHDSLPWLEYFLGTLVAAYREFEERVGAVTVVRGAKKEMVIDAIRHLPDEFQYADIQRACPTVSRPTIARALAKMRDRGEIRLVKPGRDALWVKMPKT